MRAHGPLRASHTPGLYRGEPEDDAAAGREQAPPRLQGRRWGGGEACVNVLAVLSARAMVRKVEGCAGRDGSILIYRREPIGAPRAVFCANAGARLCPAAIGRVTKPVTALLARAACSPCGARTGACVPRRGTGPIQRHDASRFAPLGWTGRTQSRTKFRKSRTFFWQSR